MRFARIDYSADYAYFFIGIMVLAFVFMFALSRVSPKGKRKRRGEHTMQQRTGELID